MKKLFKFTLNIYIRHFVSIFIAVIMYLPLYAMATKQQYLFSLLTGGIFAALCYCGGWKFGFRDARNIPGFYPDKSLPVKASLLAMILPMIFILLYAICPDIWHTDIPFMQGDIEFFIKGSCVKGTPDFICRMYQLPLCGFIPSQSIIGYIAALIVEPVFVIIGYFVGLYRFSIMEYISARIIFSSDNSNSNNKKNKAKNDRFRR